MNITVNNSPLSNTHLSNVSFTSNWGKQYKALKKALKNATTDAERAEIAKQLKELAANAQKAADERIKNSSTETKIDNMLEKVFSFISKTANKLNNKLTKKIDNGDSVDIAKKVTSIVLLGNTAKEVIGTCLYTVQAMTNEDLPPEKRKFVGMYDLFVGIVSTIVSLIFGVGLQSSIENGYIKMFKPLRSIPKIGLITGALAGFTSFALQTVVGKRIIAPAVATPLAGRVKKNMIAKDEAKAKAKENDSKNIDAKV